MGVAKQLDLDMTSFFHELLDKYFVAPKSQQRFAPCLFEFGDERSGLAHYAHPTTAAAVACFDYHREAQ